jgi:hypothetical protein
MAGFLGVEVVVGGVTDGLRLGRFDLEERRITIVGGYPPATQATELAHQMVHVLQNRAWTGQIDCDRDRGQSWEQVAESAAVLLASRLGWDLSQRDVEHIWSPSIPDERRDSLLPRVELAAQELFRAIGL